MASKKDSTQEIFNSLDLTTVLHASLLLIVGYIVAKFVGKFLGKIFSRHLSKHQAIIIQKTMSFLKNA